MSRSLKKSRVKKTHKEDINPPRRREEGISKPVDQWGGEKWETKTQTKARKQATHQAVWLGLCTWLVVDG